MLSDVINRPQHSLHILYARWNSNPLHAFHQSLIRPNAFSRYVKTQESDACGSKYALFKGDGNPILCEPIQQFSQSLIVFLHCSSEHHHIIHKCDELFELHSLSNVIHRPHEGGSRCFKSKRDHIVLKVSPSWGYKGCIFPAILS